MREIEFEYPWQITPTKLIQFGVEHLKNSDPFEKQVGFLLIDVGVETLFKVYLTLDSDISGAKLNHHKRIQAATGSFHQLVEAVDLSTEGRIKSDLDRVKYFHKVRNKLYHQGDGVRPTDENQSQYRKIAINLLRELIGIDLFPPEAFDEHFKKINEGLLRSSQQNLLAKNLSRLRCDLSAVIGLIRPEWTRRSLMTEVEEVWDEFSDYIDEDYRILEANVKERSERVHSILGNDLDDDFLIRELCQDFHILYLALFLQTIDSFDYKDLEYYASSRMLSVANERTIDFVRDGHYYWRGEEYKGEWLDLISEMLEWVEDIQKKIEKFIDDHITNA